MAQLRPDDVVVRVPDVVLALDATGMARVAQPGGAAVLVGPAALDLLRDLTRPQPVSEVLGGGVGVQAFLDRSAALVHLHRAGLVRGPSEPLPPSTAPFDSFEEHARMLADVPRTQAFLQAVRTTVRPGDVVVDIGTGTGVLAAAAALAGARHVYAVEAGAVADVARAVFERNGVTDRVTLVRGWSTEVELPERADVLVSETIGSEPLGERILEVFRDARSRHVKPGARFIPSALELHAAGYQVRPEWDGTFSPEQVASWSDRYGMDLACLAERHGRQGLQLVPVEEVAAWTALTASTLLTRLDLTSVADLRLDARVEAEVVREGRLDGLVLHFIADVGTTRLTTDPRTTRRSSWMLPLTPVAPRRVGQDDRLRLRYRYRSGGSDGMELVEALAERDGEP